eukprot:m.268373 g.268373  ORF g.268373 m.268373 type:complete len:648 (+) comp17651_c0_seq6:142-2085(+)
MAMDDGLHSRAMLNYSNYILNDRRARAEPVARQFPADFRDGRLLLRMLHAFTGERVVIPNPDPRTDDQALGNLRHLMKTMVELRCPAPPTITAVALHKGPSTHMMQLVWHWIHTFEVDRAPNATPLEVTDAVHAWLRSFNVPELSQVANFDVSWHDGNLLYHVMNMCSQALPSPAPASAQERLALAFQQGSQMFNVPVILPPEQWSSDRQDAGSVLLYLILLRNAVLLPQELAQPPAHFETTMTPLAIAANQLLYPNGLPTSHQGSKVQAPPPLPPRPLTGGMSQPFSTSDALLAHQEQQQIRQQRERAESNQHQPQAWQQTHYSTVYESLDDAAPQRLVSQRQATDEEHLTTEGMAVVSPRRKLQLHPASNPALSTGSARGHPSSASNQGSSTSLVSNSVSTQSLSQPSSRRQSDATRSRRPSASSGRLTLRSPFDRSAGRRPRIGHTVMLTPQRRSHSQPTPEPAPVPLESLHSRSAVEVGTDRPPVSTRRSAPILSASATPAKSKRGHSRGDQSDLPLRGWQGQGRTFQQPSYVLAGAMVVPCVVDRAAVRGLQGPAWLVVTYEDCRLLHQTTHSALIDFPFESIRRYGCNEEGSHLLLDIGSIMPSIQGSYKLRVTNAQQVLKELAARIATCAQGPSRLQAIV